MKSSHLARECVTSILTQTLDYAKCLASDNCVEIALGRLAPEEKNPPWRRKVEGLEQGIMKSKEQDLEQGKLDDLLKIIYDKFGTMPKRLPGVLNKAKSLTLLDELIRLAVKTDTLEKMLAEIQKIDSEGTK